MNHRSSDPWTSEAAARSVEDAARTERNRLLRAYEECPDGLTDEEAAEMVGARGCWWKRCSELRALGRIRPTGRTRSGVSGRSRIVCKIVEVEP